MKYAIVYFRDSKYFECFFRLFYNVLLSSNNFFITGTTDTFFLKTIMCNIRYVIIWRYKEEVKFNRNGVTFRLFTHDFEYIIIFYSRKLKF